MLFTGKQRHRLGSHFSAYFFFISIGEYADKRIHPFAGSLAQCHICNFYHSLNLICFSLIESGGKGKK